MMIKSVRNAMVVAVLAGRALAGSIDLTNGLVGYYPFNGDTLDASGRGHDAENWGAAFETNRFGQSSTALDLSGFTNWVNVPHHSDLALGTGDFAFAMWLKYGPQTREDYAAVLIKSTMWYPWVGPTVFVDYPSPGRVTYRTVGYGEAYSSGSGFNDNQWRHFAFVREGTKLKLFVNGALDSSVEESPIRDVTTTEPLWLGCNQEQPLSQNYTGLMDDLRIYNRALNASEVEQLYVAGMPPQVSFVKAFTVDFSHLTLGSNYQLQASADMSNWTNWGPVFTATDSNYTNTDYQRIESWAKLFWRLEVVP